VYKFTRAQFAAFPSPLSGALNLLRVDLGFPERHPRLNSYAPSGAKAKYKKLVKKRRSYRFAFQGMLSEFNVERR
jgi:hypothetical protein